MNFFGLLWVISAIGSFLTPLDAPKAVNYLSRTIPTQVFSLIHKAVGAPGISNKFAQPAPAPRHATSGDNSLSLLLLASLRTAKLAAFNPSTISQSNHDIGRNSALHFQWSQPPHLLKLPHHVAQGLKQTAPAIVLPHSRSIATSQLLDMQLAAQMALSQEISSPVLQLVDNLFRWSEGIRDIFRFTIPLVTVVQVPNACFTQTGSAPDLYTWSATSHDSVQAAQFSACTGLWQNDVSLPEPAGTVFQVRIRDRPIAEVPTRAQAEKLARRFHQILHNPQFNPYSLWPDIVDGLPVGKAGDEVLFWLEAETALLLDRNAELLIVDWINNFRAALDVPTLSLAEAQSQMYAVVPTKHRISGTASWYGPYFHGRLTATGEIYDQHGLTAAHPSLPFDTYLQVTNLLTGKKVIVRVNDRGPYFENRSLDLSREAARCLGSEITGVVPYEAVVMEKVEMSKFAKRDSNPASLKTHASLWATRP